MVNRTQMFPTWVFSLHKKLVSLIFQRTQCPPVSKKDEMRWWR